MSTQGVPGRYDPGYGADGLQEGVGEWPVGGGSYPVIERESAERRPQGWRTVPPIVAAVNLVVLAVPGLWILGLVLGGAPGATCFWPVLLLVLAAGGTTAYWLLRHSS